MLKQAWGHMAAGLWRIRQEEQVERDLGDLSFLVSSLEPSNSFIRPEVSWDEVALNRVHAQYFLNNTAVLAVCVKAPSTQSNFGHLRP